MKALLLSSAALAGLSAAVIATPALAQATPVPTAGSSATPNADATGSVPAVPTQATESSTGRLEDIVVTARRRAESAQTVPVAVSVVSAESLAQHQVTNAYQLVNLAPSLQVQSAAQEVGAVNFTIRGIGTAVFGTQTEASVGLVIDDVVMSRAQFGNVQFFDLDRVEVLRGPQGMLFGKNAAAGLINITTAQPKLGRSEFLANVDYGNSTAPGSGNGVMFQVAGNTPVTGNSALRVALFVNRQDGFVRDLKLSDDLGIVKVGGRLKYLWEPSSSVRLTASADYQDTNGPAESVLVHRYTAPGGLISSINASNGVFASPTNTTIATDVPNTNSSKLYGGSLKAEIDLGGGYTLTNVVGHRVYENNTSLDTDTTTADLFDVNHGGSRLKQTTEELRLSSPSTGRFSYQLGLFYLDLSSTSGLLQGANLGVPMPSGTSLIGGFLGGGFGTKSYAGFFEGQFKITNSFRLTGGARYTHDAIRVAALLTNPAAALPLYPALDYEKRTTQGNISYRFGLDYDIAPGVLAYATYTRGYKAPTFDGFSGTRVAPEIPKSFELGVKSTLFDRRLRLNVALFDTTFENFQTQAQIQGSASGFMLLNAGQLKSRGAEVEFTALPFEGLTISGGVTYNHTKYVNLPGIPCYYGQPTGTSGTNVCLPDGTTDVSGNQLSNAPRWTTAVTARYEHPVSSTLVGFMQGDVYHRSSFKFSQTLDPQTRVGASAIVGLSAGVRTADGKVSLTAFVRNLLDKRIPSFILADPAAGVYVGPTGKSDAALGGNYWQAFGPNSFRTIGLSLSYRM
ncbi:TonB-dependent receptor [Sphingomonas mali]|uniref:TonB-dependent receptor n=1 Tax=Sphingomonas mali TaxID=40682 RepID=UPI0008311F02|nr:TonB-dependent receptor [Sphingomonas mali]